LDLGLGETHDHEFGVIINGAPPTAPIRRYSFVGVLPWDRTTVLSKKRHVALDSAASNWVPLKVIAITREMPMSEANS
jgi:hypothetical protein